MKTNLLKLTVFSLVLAGSVYSCAREDCRGFPKHLADYCPYRLGDTLSFVNQHNDTISFETTTSKMVEDHSIDGDWCTKCACESPILYYYALKTNLQTAIEIIIEASTKSYISFQLSDSYLYSYAEAGKDPFDPKNAALFGERVVLENPQARVSRALIIRGRGITEFYDQQNDFLWKSINR